MCGILGTVNVPFRENTLDLLRHRGPDDADITRDLVGHHQVTLGHRRLAIMDLSPAGRQPMRTLNSNFSIVFNGEVYNHLDLRARGPQVPYRGHSDTETVLNYLARQGINSVGQFNGIFALGLLDTDNQKLFLARDPFGVKPLYYWSDDRAFAFSSELRPLSSLIEDSVDAVNLADLLRLRYLPAPETLFRKIRKVRPGHIVEVNLSGVHLSAREYPFLEPPPGEIGVRRKREAIERYGNLVEEAVKRQLMSDVKVGIFLSGGVDSALIASIAQKHCTYQMKAFTVGFNDRGEADEIAEAQDTARFVGLEHHHARIGFRDFLDLMPRVTRIVEEPLATTSMLPMYFLASLAAPHGKVVLSGQGADEAMGGYRRYQGEFVQSHTPRWTVPILQTAAHFFGVQNDAVLRGVNSMEELDDVSRFEAVYSVFSRNQIMRLTGVEPVRTSQRIRYFYDLLQCARYRRSVQRMMAVDLRMSLADDLLLYTDKITMYRSIECRVPLLDLELVRFVESLPSRYRVGALRGKILHKLSAQRFLPANIVRRKKRGFMSPTREWFSKTPTLREILLDPASRFATYFNLDEVKTILLEHTAGINRERQLFLLLNLYYWLAEPTPPRNQMIVPAASVN